MQTIISNTNQSFDILKGSSKFLNLVLDNINCCIMLLDQQMNLRAFNNPLTTLFPNKKDSNLLYRKCGEVIGCAKQIEEKMQCGTTPFCNDCELRIAALISYSENTPIKKNITKEFYDSTGNKFIKQFTFSTRLFKFEKETYIVMIISEIDN